MIFLTNFDKLSLKITVMYVNSRLCEDECDKTCAVYSADSPLTKLKNDIIESQITRLKTKTFAEARAYLGVTYDSKTK